MDQKGKVARAARAEYPDLPGLLGNRPMSVIQTPWNSNSISYWTHDESSVIGYRLRDGWDKGFVTDYRHWAAPFIPRRDSASIINAVKQVESTAHYPPQRAANASYTASNPAISQQQNYTAPVTLFELVQSSSEDSVDGIRRRVAGLQTELDDLNFKIAELDLERKRLIIEYQRTGKHGKYLKNRRNDREKELAALISLEHAMSVCRLLWILHRHSPPYCGREVWD
ncbi:hypothetical protein SLS61_008834 [Didymella pomorum]